MKEREKENAGGREERRGKREKSIRPFNAEHQDTTGKKKLKTVFVVVRNNLVKVNITKEENNPLRAES